PLGLNNLGWTAADNSGNVTTCAYDLTVVDGTAPTVGMLDSIEVNVAINSCSRVITLDQPDYADIAFSDNCSLSGNVTLTRDPIATVNGVADPDILKFTGFDPSTSPNAAVITFAVGTTLLRYIWTDEAGNATTRIFKVVVKETTPPVAKCKTGPLDVFLNANGTAVVSANDIDAGSTDNCLGIKSLSVSPSSFNCTNLAGTPTVTLTVTDNSDNTATCSTTVDVKDNLAPSVICPANQTVRALANCKTPAASIAGLALSLQPATTTLTLPGQYKDNAYNPALGCNTPPTVTYTLVSQTPGSFTGPASGSGAVAGSGVVFNEGTTTVTYLFNDGSNAPSVCSFNVTVADLDAPTVSCPANISLDATLGLCTATATLPAATATDNCTANPVLLQSHSTGFPFPVGVTTVTYTAIDQTGRAGTCSFTVTVRDTQFPVAKCKDVTVYLGASGSATLEPKDLDNGSTDNCPNLQYGNPPLYTFTCGIPSLTQTLTVRDGAGNTATCTSNVTVLDTIKPK
ncbi:MAG TPA: HYR domain-containing protein, partial [Saprospiraceae bacterium]|nr:HYR domain-containing protein [Saprospiraceae bacterium]